MQGLARRRKDILVEAGLIHKEKKQLTGAFPFFINFLFIF